jgi:purine nucleosidase
MGGNFLYPGNVTPAAEANFHGDPIATDLVLEKGRNITIVPLNVTNGAVVSPEVVNLISAYPYNPFSTLIKSIIEFYIDAYKSLIPGLNGAPMHDVLTLFALRNPQAFQSVSRRVRVDASQLSRGRTIADFRPKPDPEPPETLDKILMQFDYNAFISDFVRIMTSRI